MKKKQSMMALFTVIVFMLVGVTAEAASQSKKYVFYEKNKQTGALVSNVWRRTDKLPSGNTYQWDYLVSGEYTGSKKVEKIRTTWQGMASLRNSASISLGISNSGGSVGSSASWATAKTKEKYWENNNGVKQSSYRSNIVVAPKKDYRNGTISIINTARIKFKGDPRTFEISSGV